MHIPEYLWHGSPKKNLKEIVPGKIKNSNHPREVFASAQPVVAALFTLSPDTVHFLFDLLNQRIFVPDAKEFVSKDRGGSIYQVTGDFRLSADTNIFEYEAPRAKIIQTMVIQSARSFLVSHHFELYADQNGFEEIENFWAEKLVYPVAVPRGLKPFAIY